MRDKCLQHAAALAYATLLATLPLIVLGFSFITTFHTFGDIEEKIQATIFHFLLPESRQAITVYFADISSRAGTLSALGIVALLFTASALINTLEDSFNHIFRVRESRSLMTRFNVFWTILTLWPLLIGVSMTITSYMATLPPIHHLVDKISIYLNYLLPWMIASGAFAILYVIAPNIKVNIRHAVVGGMFAAILFLVSAHGFTYYMVGMSYLERLYGVLGMMPVFLVWLYISWIVVLTGAELVYCVGHPVMPLGSSMASVQSGQRYLLFYQILVMAAQCQATGLILSEEMVARELGISQRMALDAIDRLSRLGLLKPIAKEGWVLNGLPEHISTGRIVTLLDERVPEGLGIPEDSLLGKGIADILSEANRNRQESLARTTLKDLTCMIHKSP